MQPYESSSRLGQIIRTYQAQAHGAARFADSRLAPVIAAADFKGTLEADTKPQCRQVAVLWCRADANNLRPAHSRKGVHPIQPCVKLASRFPLGYLRTRRTLLSGLDKVQW